MCASAQRNLAGQQAPPDRATKCLTVAVVISGGNTTAVDFGG
jgi:hypothetical protein